MPPAQCRELEPMSEMILWEEMEEALDSSCLLLEQKAVWREAQHTNLLLELSSTGCLCGEASAPFHQSSCLTVRLVSQR